jgi:hypothetical protein
MPTYANSTHKLIMLGSERVEPGATIVSPVWYATLPTGITQTANTPVFSNVLASSIISGTGTYTVPASITDNYLVRIYVPAGGLATFKLNDSTSVADSIGPGDTREYRCSRRTLDNIIWSAITGNVYLTIFAV